MHNTGMLKFHENDDRYGHLVPIEGGENIPFNIKRVYYIYGVQQGVTRGYHSHRKLHQVLICVSGSVKIRLKNPTGEEVVLLNNPAEGLYIGPMIWREMFDFTQDAVLLVLASEHYTPEDYIRNHDEYSAEAARFFGKEE